MQYVVIDGKKHFINWRELTHTAKVLAPLIGEQAVCHSKIKEISEELQMIRSLFDRDVLGTYQFSVLIGVMTLNAYVVPEGATKEVVNCTRGVNLEDSGVYRPETVLRMAAKAADYISKRTAELHYVIEEACESFNYGASRDNWESYCYARQNASRCGHLSMGHAAHLLSIWTGASATGGESQCANGTNSSTLEHYPDAALVGLYDWMNKCPQGDPCGNTEFGGTWVLAGDKIARLRKARVQPVVCSVPGLDGPMSAAPCWHHYPMGAAISAIGPRKFKDHQGYSSDVAQWLRLGAGGKQPCCTGPGINFLGLPTACNQCLGKALGIGSQSADAWRMTACALAKVLGVAQYAFKVAILRIVDIAAREAVADMARARAILVDLAQGGTEQMAFLQALSRAVQDPDRKRVRLLLATQDPITRASVAREADVIEAWNSAVVRRIHHCCPWDKMVKHPEVSSYAAYMTLTEEAFTAWGSMAALPPTRLCDYQGWESCVNKLPEGLRVVLGRASLHRVMGLSEVTLEIHEPAAHKVKLIASSEAWPSGLDAAKSSELVPLPKVGRTCVSNGDDMVPELPCFEPVGCDSPALGATNYSQGSRDPDPAGSAWTTEGCRARVLGGCGAQEAEPRFFVHGRVATRAAAWTTEGTRLYSRNVEDLVEAVDDSDLDQRERVRLWLNATDAANMLKRQSGPPKSLRVGARTLDCQQPRPQDFGPACVVSERVSGSRFASMSDSEDSLDGRPAREYPQRGGLLIRAGARSPSPYSESEWGEGSGGRHAAELEVSSGADGIVWPVNADDMF